jgi:hypothetical protein
MNNQIRDLPEELFELKMEINLEKDRGKGIHLKGNPIEKPPPEILKQGLQAIRDYFRELKGSEAKNYNVESVESSTPKTSSSMKLEIPAPPNIHDMDHKPVIGAKELSRELAELLNNQCSDKAMMVGLFGQWGRGKTFLMEQIWKELELKGDKNNFERVDFHAWKYQDTPASWAYLYEAFTNKYFSLPQKKDDEEFPKRKYIFKYIQARIRNYWRLIKVNIGRHGWWPLVPFGISVAVYIFLTTIGFKSKLDTIYKILGFLFSVPLFGYISTKVIFRYRKKAIQLFKKYTKKKSYKELLGIQKEIQDELRILLKTWIPRKKLVLDKKIMLFVDDLDRCRDERLIQIIDSMRVMLEDKVICRRVVALIAVDERILTRAIRFKYQNIIEEDDEKKGDGLTVDKLTREYLDKLFLLGIKLNPLRDTEKNEILANIAKGRIAPSDERSNETGGKLTELQPTSENRLLEKPLKANEKKASEKVEEKSYKITRSLLTEKKIRKLIKPYVQDIKILREQNEVYGLESFKSILENRLRIPGIVIEQILPYAEFQVDINEAEYKRLLQLLPLLQNATPRNIRIIYYQYILAKRLLEKDSGLYQESSGTSVLMDLLFIVSLYRFEREMADLHDLFSNSNFKGLQKELEEKKCPESKDICRDIVSGLEKINLDELKELLKLLEIVVPY